MPGIPNYYCIDFEDNDYFFNKISTYSSNGLLITVAYCNITENENCHSRDEAQKYLINPYFGIGFIDNLVEANQFA